MIVTNVWGSLGHMILCVCVLSHSFLSSSLQPHRLQLGRLLC